MNGGAAKYKVSALIEPDSDNAKNAKAAMLDAAKKLWAENAVNVVKSMAANNKALRNGNDKLRPQSIVDGLRLTMESEGYAVRIAGSVQTALSVMGQSEIQAAIAGWVVYIAASKGLCPSLAAGLSIPAEVASDVA